MGSITDNRKEIFLKILSSWEGRKVLCDEYFKIPLSIAQLAKLLDISDPQLRENFHTVWNLASEGIQMKEGFFAVKLDTGYQVRAQQGLQLKMVEFPTESEALDFFINVFPATQPLPKLEDEIENIFIDYSLRKFAQYIDDPQLLFIPVAERAAYIGIVEDRLKEVVKNRYVRPPYEIEYEDDRGIKERIIFANEDEMADYFLR